MEPTPTEAAAEVPYWQARPGTAPIKSEYVRWDLMRSGPKTAAIDDDAAEGRTRDERPQRAPEVVKEVAKEGAPAVESAELPAAAGASTSTPLEHTPPSDPEQGPPAKKIRLSGAQKKAAARERSEIAWQAKKAEKEAEKEAKAAAKAAGIEVEVAAEGDGEGGGRKKGKGQNKGRKFDHRAGTDAIKLCVMAARGDECPRSKDGSCRWSHDVSFYIAERAADIPISLPVSADDLTLVNSDRICPHFTSLGQCPYGFKCRYGLSHMRKVADGEGALGSGWELVVDAEKVTKLQSERGEGVKERREKGEGNVIFMDRIKAIRGQGVEREDRFPLATAYLKSIGEPIDLREAVHGDTGAGHARGKGRGSGGRGGGRGGRGRDGGRPATEPEAAEVPVSTEDAMEVDATPVVAVSTDVLAGAFPPLASIDAAAAAIPLLPSTDAPSSIGHLPPTESSAIATTAATDATRPLSSTDAVPPIESSAPALIDIDSQPSRTFAPDLAPVRPTEKRRLDFAGKLYLAPLSTVGNLPFRRLAGDYGNDISCSEMGLAQEFLVGNSSEWSLVRRHPSEKIFGVQICGSRPQALIPAAEAIVKACDIDFLDVNCGCPIDLVFNKGAGSALLQHATKLGKSLVGMSQVLGEVPLTIKIRSGVVHSSPVAHKLMPRMQKEWGVGAITIHGRSRAQRYKNLADYSYIAQCVKTVRESEADEGLPRIPIFGNGDAYDYRTYYENMEASGVDGIMLARGALIKPWIFTEIKERRDWDISSRERLDMVGKLANYGIEHWGSDTMGINTTRRFLCEALSFQHRYIPVGLLERLPIALNERAMPYRGRDELETLLASDQSEDWVKLTSMFLGPPPEEWSFQPKHKANATVDAEVQG